MSEVVKSVAQIAESALWAVAVLLSVAGSFFVWWSALNTSMPIAELPYYVQFGVGLAVAPCCCAYAFSRLVRSFSAT